MTQELTIREQPGMLTPAEVVEGATAQAKLLMSIVEQTKCYQQIANKKYLQVEAWETIGAFNRTHAETESITPVVRDGETIGYQAHVQLWKDGHVVGGAVMPCYFTENCCKGKDGDAKHKASMSAAQTFAESKAFRMNFSYVAILAGYQPLPAEEITEDMRTETKTENTKEHFCKEHNTAFFMKGKMKSHAHPIGDTGVWCHEHKENKPPDNVDTQTGEIFETEEAPAKSKQDPAILLNLKNLKDSMKTLDWTTEYVCELLHSKYQVTGDKVTDCLKLMDSAMQSDFWQHIQGELKQVSVITV